MDSKQKKLAKHPDAPKKPMTSYFLWAQDTRLYYCAKLKAEFPDAPIMGQLGVMQGTEWRKLDDETKHKYAAKAEILLVNYLEQKRIWEISHPPELNQIQQAVLSNSAQKKKKFFKDPNALKRPLSAYLCFTSSCREQIKADNVNIPVTDIMKKQGEAWKLLSEAERQKYEVQAALLKAEYDAKMVEIKKNEIKEDLGPKRPPSSYLCFTIATRDQIKAANPDIVVTDIMKKQGEMWKTLENKSFYEEQAKALKDKYDVELAAWKVLNPNGPTRKPKYVEPVIIKKIRQPAAPRPKKTKLAQVVMQVPQIHDMDNLYGEEDEDDDDEEDEDN